MNRSINPTSLSVFRTTINDYRVRIDNAIMTELNRHEDSIFFEPLMKALKGGKRLRPILLILSYESVNKRKMDPFSAAVAVELVHTESLIHDDIIDGDFLRRTVATFHASYGNEMSLLSADFILSMILDITAKYADSRVAQTLALATSEMCEGELEELLAYRKQQKLGESEYINIVSKKTASLFEASTTIGAIIAEAKENEIRALSKFGRLIGIAYQIQDDIADLKKTDTINILKRLDRNSERIKTFHKMSKSYVLEAKRKLEAFETNDAKTLLKKLADHIVSNKVTRF